MKSSIETVEDLGADLIKRLQAVAPGLDIETDGVLLGIAHSKDRLAMLNSGDLDMMKRMQGAAIVPPARVGWDLALPESAALPARFVVVQMPGAAATIAIKPDAAREMMLDHRPLERDMSDSDCHLATLKALGAAMLSIGTTDGCDVDPGLSATVSRAVLDCASALKIAELKTRAAVRITDQDGAAVVEAVS